MVAEHCLRHSVIAKLFDNVDAAVALSNNNRRGWGRAGGSGCAEGSDGEGMLNRAAGNAIREKFVLCSPLLSLFSCSHWLATKRRYYVDYAEDTGPHKSWRRMCGLGSLPWWVSWRDQAPLGLGLLAEVTGFGCNFCDARALFHCRQGETTKPRSHRSPYSCHVLLPFKHYQPGVSFNI